MEITNKRRRGNDGSYLLPQPVYRVQVLRLILQSLRAFGYSQSAERLEQESGVGMEAEAVGQFRLEVLEGHWEEAVRLLATFNLKTEEQMQVLYCLKRQKYLELIEKQDFLQAFHCLRSELVPLKPGETAALAGLLLSSSAQELREDADWEGSGPQARLHLLHQVQTHFPPSVMLPPDRLQILISQALEGQST